MSAGFTVTGADTLKRTARTAADELGNLTATNARVAAAILAAARPPVRTGRLSNSGAASSSPTEAVVTYSAPYAAIVERRRGFLAAALAARTTPTVAAYTAAVNTAVGGIRGA